MMFPPSHSLTLLLFDIDGTLIHAGGAGKRALEQAFEHHIGEKQALNFSFSGRTDRNIIREGLIRSSTTLNAEIFAEIEKSYLQYLSTEINNATDYAVLPGVIDLLNEADQRDDICVGLGTGNLKEGAEIKLSRSGLLHFFDFGGFGSDHEDRDQILRISANRGAKHSQVELEDCRIVVVGDTPLDISAALAVDAECIVGVGTGESSPELLLASGATAAFINLQQEGAYEMILNGTSF